MREFNKFIGLDVHKSTIAISIAPEDGGEVRYFGVRSPIPMRP